MEHHDHTHHQSSHENPVYLPQDERVDDPNLLKLVTGKVAASIGGLVAGIKQQAVTTSLDSAHGVLENGPYIVSNFLIGSESKPEQPSESRFAWLAQLKQKLAANKDKVEKINYALISAPALGAVAWAGANLYQNVNKLAGGNTEAASFDSWDAAHLGATGLALAFTVGIWQSARKTKEKVLGMDLPSANLQRYARDQKKHADIDVLTTGLAFAEGGAHAWGHPGVLAAANSVALGLSGYLAWRFRPWSLNHKHNQEGNHSDCHGHAHLDLIPPEFAGVAGKLFKTSKAAGASALNRIIKVSRDWRDNRKKYKEIRQKSAWVYWLEKISQQPGHPLADMARAELKNAEQIGQDNKLPGQGT